MNIPKETDHTSRDFLQSVMALETKLEAWKSSLPDDLKIQSKEQTIQRLIDTSTMARLSIVLSLRYLNARTLLHRIILIVLLDREAQKTNFDNDSIFLRNAEAISLELSVASATEVIQIHHAIPNHSPPMLTIWWFSVYYSKLLTKTKREVSYTNLCKSSILRSSSSPLL